MSVQISRVKEFSAVAGQAVLVELPISQRGILHTLRVKADSSVTGDKTAKFAIFFKDISDMASDLIYDSSDSSDSSYSYESEGASLLDELEDLMNSTDAPLYQTTPYLDVDSTGVYQLFEKVYAYTNVDSTITVATKKLYLLFATVGGDGTWRISYDYSSPTF